MIVRDTLHPGIAVREIPVSQDVLHTGGTSQLSDQRILSRCFLDAIPRSATVDPATQLSINWRKPTILLRLRPIDYERCPTFSLQLWCLLLDNPSPPLNSS